MSRVGWDILTQHRVSLYHYVVGKYCHRHLTGRLVEDALGAGLEFSCRDCDIGFHCLLGETGGKPYIQLMGHYTEESRRSGVASRYRILASFSIVGESLLTLEEYRRPQVFCEKLRNMI